MLDVHQLNVFLAAAETLSFTQAAARLHMAQPSVSQHIQALERRFEAPLFLHSGRSLELTDAGLALLPLAREAVALSIRIDETMESLKGNIYGHLIVACSTTPGKYILPQVLARFHRSHPQVSVTCNVMPQSSALESIAAGESDFGLFSIAEASPLEIEAHPYICDPIVLIAPLDHPWARKQEITPEELLEGDFIQRELSSGTQQAVREALARCVILYSTVLLMEVTVVVGDSSIGERLPWLRSLGHRLHKLTPVLALFGMALSLLHQSSLGATCGVLSGRALWFKPSLPVMFIISAVAGGMALTLFSSMAVSTLRKVEILPPEVCSRVTRVVGFVTLGYLYIKLWDWAATTYYSNSPATADILARLNATTPYNATFWGVEVLLAGVVPAALLLNPQTCRRRGMVMAALVALTAAGVIINRWNITLSGLVAPPSWSPGVLGNVAAVAYFPSAVEIVVALGIAAYALLGFTLGARYLSIYPRKEAARRA